MKLLKLKLVIFGVLIYMGSDAQLTTQKKFGVGTYANDIIRVDLKANGILMLTPGYGGRVIRLNNNYDTVWVKLITDFAISDVIVNSDNEIIITGQRIYPTATNFGGYGIEILKIDLNGNLISSKYRESGTGELTFPRLYPSIVEYKANHYILSFSEFQNQGTYASIILKLDNDFNVIDSKITPFTGNFIYLLPRHLIAKKSDSEIIFYPKPAYTFYAFYSGAYNTFLVIDTNLNNTYNKRLNDPARKINSVAVSGEDIFIGGNILTNKLINNQFDNNEYYTSYLTKLNVNTPPTYRNRSLLFYPGYVAKSNHYLSDFYMVDNSIYSSSFGAGYNTQTSNSINDSLSKNFRTRITKFDTSLQIKWNKRLHIYGTADTAGFQEILYAQNINFEESANFLLKKNNQILNFAYHIPSSNSSNNVLPSEIGFSLTAIDTSGNNATCNATDEAYLYKYDSVEVLNEAVLNYTPYPYSLNNNSQNIVSVPLNKISNVCLPLLKTKSKFFWYPLNSSGNDTVVCKDSKIYLFDRSYNEPKTWHWIFPPQVNTTELDSLYLPDGNAISFTQAGVFPVSLVTTNDAGTDTATQYFTVINFIPQPYLGNDTTICNGDSVRIIYTDPPNSDHYFYGPGVYTTSDTLVIRDSGQYIIAAYSACGYQYDTINIQLVSKPTANFGFNVICDNLTVAFTDSSQLNGNPAITYQYAWKPAFAPPTAYTNYSTQPNNSFTFAAYDSFDVRQIVQSTGICGVQRDTIVKRIILKAKPVAACSAVTNCGSLQASFTSSATIASGSIIQQEYYVGNTLIGTGAGFNYSFAAYGSYTVKQVVKSNFNCISDTFLLPVIIKDKPQVNLITPRDSVCNSSYTINANATVNASTITSYVWLKNNIVLPNNTSTITENDPPGTYTYKLVATSALNCSSDTATKIITVVSKPTTTFNAVTSCGSKSIAITASSLVVNDFISNHYINYGDGNTSAANPNNTTYTYANFGFYNLKYVVQSSIGCASDTAYQTIDVKDKFVINIGYSNNACNNTNYILTANTSVAASTITNYTWLKNNVLLTGNSNTITENNPAGTYTYKLAASSTPGCSSDTALLTVVVQNYPASIFNAAGGCVGNPITITNSSTNNNTVGSLQYLWATSDGQTSTAIVPNFSFATSGTKTIQLTASTQNGCANSNTKTITIDALPIAAFEITEACIGKNLVISNNSIGTITSYAWQTSNAQQSSSVVPTTFVFNTPGNYSIKLDVATANNCSTTLTKTTPIKPPVQLITQPGIDINANVNQPVQLSITGADTYSWQPFTNLTNANSSNPVFKTTVPGIYPLSIQATTAQGCKASATMIIKVFAASDYLLIPNAFTPDGNALNDKFNFTCSGLQSLTFFRVYNRYGQIVYQQNTCNNIGWDGTFKGTKQPGGAYVYNWQGVAFNGLKVSGQGALIMLR